MRWNSTSNRTQVKSSAPTFGTSAVRRGDVSYRGDWDVDRAVHDALEKVTWVFRCVDAIASNASRQEIITREGNPWDGEVVSDPELYRVLNSKANEGEAAIIFRYRLSAQLLLSKRGVFVQVVRSNAGDVLELFLLPPDCMRPIKDKRTLVKGWELVTTDENGNVNKKKFKADEVIWLRRPHPFDPYQALTPLEAAGLAIETDWLAKTYNRNFLLNDGRPGGMVVIKGDMMEEDKEELRARFSGGVARAGRISVIASEDGADFVDTAVTPRDAQYAESRQSTKDEILLGFGVPESVLANASGRCVDADTEALTQRGWVDGRSLTTDDVILSVDPADGALKWSPIHEVYRNEDYSGPMYRVEDFLVTPGHNWLVRSTLSDETDAPFTLRRVEDLTATDRVLTIGLAEDSNKEPRFSDNFVELVGQVVGSGQEGEVGGVTAAALWLGALSRKFILALTADQRELLMQAMLEAGGSPQISTIAFTQKNEAEAFVFLATLSGCTTSVVEDQFDCIIDGVATKSVQYRVIVHYRAILPVQSGGQEVVENYKGLVWCPRTDYGTFVARRHGKVMVTGNTFDNAEVERLVFWQETMLTHLDLITRPMDDLDWDDSHFLSVNLERVDVLQRMEMKRREFLLREFDAGASDVNEYREATGREIVPGPWGKVHWISKNKKMSAMSDGSDFPDPVAQDVSKSTAGQPQSQQVVEEPEDETGERNDERLPSLPNTETTPADASAASDGKKEVDPEFLVRVKADYELYTELAMNVMDRLSERLARVASQKISGPKFRSAYFKSDSSVDSLVGVTFSDETWANQLVDDLTPVANGAFKDSNTRFASALGVDATDPEVAISTLFVHQLNGVVADAIKTFVEGGSGKIDEFSDEVKDRLVEYMASTKARDYVENVVVTAYNEGIDEAASKAGVLKMWVALGDSPGQRKLDGCVANGSGFKLGRKTLKVPSGTLSKAVIVPIIDDVPVI